MKSSQLHLTADKRLRRYAPLPKLPSATSFIRNTLGEIARILKGVWWSKKIYV